MRQTLTVLLFLTASLSYALSIGAARRQATATTVFDGTWTATACPPPPPPPSSTAAVPSVLPRVDNNVPLQPPCPLYSPSGRSSAPIPTSTVPGQGDSVVGSGSTGGAKELSTSIPLVMVLGAAGLGILL
ncbi:hypothetical protein B0H16DRAFT_1594203 [Mycena metata]|uniref:Uncharacterized protein n=1 Tax=Mycena metata TaxID=1033252 RepID=A0AAD7HR47_9AGAR|nr:hypothetical protein B0H16DRAFT_1594203 [Mycena metata]